MNVPKLRFKEFNDEWKKAQLSSFVNINPKNDSLPEKFIYIDLESVNNGLLTSRKIINKSEAPSRAQRTIIKNDILYQTVRPYQMNNLFINSLDSTYPYIASTGYALLRTEENPYFVYSILHQKSFVNKVLDKCTGTSYPAISANDLGAIIVGLPSIKEQEKISRTFELLDKKIELQSKKIEDLKLFKLYIRKKIFSSNTNNNIRLKEIVNCEFSNITLVDIENDNGIYPVYGATGFIKNIKNYNFDSEYIAIVKDGAGVGRTMICPKNSSILATMNALTIKNNYPLNYICEMINTISFDKYIVGSGIPHIYFKDYGNEEFMLHNENDANKFDSVFKCLDRKIELLNVSLDKLNILKKGLMQGMFV